MYKTGISCDFRSYARSKQSHIHDYAQVVLPLSGELEMAAGGRTTRLSPSKAIIISPETPHDFESARNGIFFVLDIAADGRALSEKSKRLFLSNRNKAVDGIISAPHQRLLRFLSEEFYKSSGNLFRCQPLLEAIVSLIELPSSNEVEVGDEPCYWNRPNTSTIRSAAAHHGMSESTFRRTIKKNYGESPKRLQMDERLVRAEQLLLTTDRPVSSVAFDVGFSNCSAFTNAFRRKLGLTPSDFRKLRPRS